MDIFTESFIQNFILIAISILLGSIGSIVITQEYQKRKDLREIKKELIDSVATVFHGIIKYMQIMMKKGVFDDELFNEKFTLAEYSLRLSSKLFSYFPETVFDTKFTPLHIRFQGIYDQCTTYDFSKGEITLKQYDDWLETLELLKIF